MPSRSACNGRGSREPSENEPATLVLRVEGPAAIEIQHLSGLIIERVNRFFGWQAIDRLALRQAPLTRRGKPKSRPPLDPAAAERIAGGLTGITDESLARRARASGRGGQALVTAVKPPPFNLDIATFSLTSY